MLDKNGIEMKTGMIVQISGAYFKNDNGTYYIDRSPGDAGWNGKDYSLKKISKSGKISTAKYNLAFWPLVSYVSDMRKTAAANDHNRKHAQIEIVTIENMQEVKAHFQKEADEAAESIRNYERRFHWDGNTLALYQAMQAHYQAVADSIR